MHPKKLLDALGAAPLKKLSQNFLVSPHWAEKLTDECLSSPHYDEVWEIGPGLGALTEHLVKKTGKPIRLFEFDKKLAARLRTQFTTLDVREGDFLKADLEPLFPKGKVTLLSNLPYHLSSAILIRLLETLPHWSKLVLTFQKEFADRLTGEPRTKAYGSLSVMAQLHFEMTALGVLPAGAFYPAPDIASAAIAFLPKAAPLPTNLESVVRSAFTQRRKKLSSNLRAVASKASLECVFNVLNLNDNIRAEELSPAQFVALAERLAAI